MTAHAGEYHALFDGLDDCFFDDPPSSQPCSPAPPDEVLRHPVTSTSRPALELAAPHARAHHNKRVETKADKENFWGVTPRVTREGNLCDTATGKGKHRAVVPSHPDDDYEHLLPALDWNDVDLLDPAHSEPLLPRDKRYTRCTVAEIMDARSEVTKRMERILSVRLSGEGLYEVVLRDDWLQCYIEIGDTINLIGPFAPLARPSLIVDRHTSLLILHPDILVSSTKVADTSHCARKALLQELIRTVGGSTPALLYGNMLHELMQACLTEGQFEDEWRETKIDEILGRSIPELWSIGLEVGAAREVMREKSSRFGEFSDRFRGDSPEPDAFLSDPNSFVPSSTRFALTQTLDVEEDIWSPKYGLKGKVDVSVAGRLATDEEDGSESIMPFEIKTGRTMSAMEHRAQTMLYTLLMADRYDEEIAEGLLYYSSSNSLIRVAPARNEIRGLLIARNDFATYLHRRAHLSESAMHLPTQVDTTTQAVEVAVEGEAEEGEGSRLLPEGIDDERSCKRCYVLDACAIYRRCTEPPRAPSTTDSLFDGKTEGLTSCHAAFFRKWERLISLEEQEMVKYKKEIWTLQADERAELGRCIAGMQIDESYAPPAEGEGIQRYTYRLYIPSSSCLLSSSASSQSRRRITGNLSNKDPVVISLLSPHIIALSRGFILEINSHDILVGLDRALTTNSRVRKEGIAAETMRWRVDKDEMSTGMGRVRDNLLQLFVQGGDEKRRSLIVDLTEPEFRPLIAVDAPNTVNLEQEQAVQKVLSAQDYALILGMPGTGKTTTIVEVLKALVRQGKSVLLTAYTHSAVDNILLKLGGMEKGSVLRVGNRDKIMPCLHHLTLDPDKKPTTLRELDDLYMTPRIVATTCLSINEAIFTKRTFDYCIVDEASQISLPTILGPLRFANVFVLVGDHNQLPPLVRNLEAERGGLGVSLFQRLADAHPGSIVFLERQYRMNESIMLLSNTLVYEGRLRCGDDEVKSRKLLVPRKEQAMKEIHQGKACGGCWIEEVLQESRDVVFVDTDLVPALERKTGRLIENPIEASLIAITTRALVASGVPAGSIGIIAPYRQQIKLISESLEDLTEVEILTADRSQGRDKECILLSLTRSNKEMNTGDLLKDWRRLNVCLTRARRKLIIFGSKSTLEHVEVLAKFFKLVQEEGWIYRLPAGAHEVHWGSAGGKREGEQVKNGGKRWKSALREIGNFY